MLYSFSPTVHLRIPVELRFFSVLLTGFIQLVPVNPDPRQSLVVLASAVVQADKAAAAPLVGQTPFSKQSSVFRSSA